MKVTDPARRFETGFSAPFTLAPLPLAVTLVVFLSVAVVVAVGAVNFHRGDCGVETIEKGACDLSLCERQIVLFVSLWVFLCAPSVSQES